MDGNPKRQAQGTELHGVKQEVPHRPADGEAVRRVAATARVHADRPKANEAGRVQATGGSVVGGGAVLSGVRILEKLKEQGFEGKYSIVKEYVRGKKMDLDEKATVRFETMPGSKAKWTGAFSRITRCMRTGGGKSCIVFS